MPSWGPPPHPGPAVHSFGNTALHSAALHGNRRIVRLLIAFNADVNVQEGSGCAFPFRNRRTWRPSLRRLPCRATPLHSATFNGASGVIEELLLSGADVAIQDRRG